MDSERSLPDTLFSGPHNRCPVPIRSEGLECCGQSKPRARAKSCEHLGEQTDAKRRENQAMCPTRVRLEHYSVPNKPQSTIMEKRIQEKYASSSQLDAAGSCQASARQALSFMKELGLPAVMARVIVEGDLKFSTPVQHPASGKLINAPDPTTHTCSSKWKFDGEPGCFWRHEADFAPDKISGALHFVAAVVIEGQLLIVDWGTAQFAEIPTDARLFLVDFSS
ncbi:hypothetical protein D9Q98_004030 [Chlorella vulgaris]|uniref:Uncharacterized protein n=1 Tax=Chlorella vulgaris TaxID=3077 RepID=A0A9D4TRI7_CHLVU|nr:hypothetical protein D9Q98_004030 [Chlorella vulgaris]